MGQRKGPQEVAQEVEREQQETQDHRGTQAPQVTQDHRGTLVLKEHRERKGYRGTQVLKGYRGTLVLLVLVAEVAQGESQ